MYRCKNCGKEFKTKQSYGGHMSVYSRKPKIQNLNTKKHICKYCNIEFESGPLLGNHVRACKQHPKYKERIEKIRLSSKGRIPSKETKRKVSESMKKAHKEGRAWNIGQSRWNNERSWPEKFFEKVIKNEFKDKNYIPEYPVGIYSLDFAWVEKKKVIEIDGDQHQRFDEYQKRDKRKDKYLIKEGWKILRIPWKSMYNNTKEEIQKCKDFIS